MTPHVDNYKDKPTKVAKRIPFFHRHFTNPIVGKPLTMILESRIQVYIEPTILRQEARYFFFPHLVSSFYILFRSFIILPITITNIYYLLTSLSNQVF